MEVKEWSYEEYPSFDMPVDRVTRFLQAGMKRELIYILMLNMRI